MNAASKPESPAKPPAASESLAAIRYRVIVLKNQLALGSKSDLDQVGARLDELIAWIEAMINEAQAAEKTAK
jgi:hypothetical protein